MHICNQGIRVSLVQLISCTAYNIQIGTLSTTACLLIYFGRTGLLALVNITTAFRNVKNQFLSSWPLFLVATGCT